MNILVPHGNFRNFALHTSNGVWGLVGPTHPRFKTQPSGGYGELNGNGNGNKTMQRKQSVDEVSEYATIDLQKGDL